MSVGVLCACRCLINGISLFLLYLFFYFFVSLNDRSLCSKNVAVPCHFSGKRHFLLLSEGHQYTLGLGYQELSS